MTEPRDPIETLWQRFRHNAQLRLDTLQAWLHGDSDHTTALQEAHKLAGALGSYGRPEGSTAAATIEARLRDHLAGHSGDPRHDPSTALLLEQLRRQIR